MVRFTHPTVNMYTNRDYYEHGYLLRQSAHLYGGVDQGVMAN